MKLEPDFDQAVTSNAETHLDHPPAPTNCLVAQQCVPNPAASFAATPDAPKPRLVTVRALAGLYGLKPATIYGFIKSDPAFPYKNVGLRKKYLVDVDQFETWLERRTTEEKNMHFGIPTATELIARFKL